jgi:hypothetical protein
MRQSCVKVVIVGAGPNPPGEAAWRQAEDFPRYALDVQVIR